MKKIKWSVVALAVIVSAVVVAQPASAGGRKATGDVSITCIADNTYSVTVNIEAGKKPTTWKLKSHANGGRIDRGSLDAFGTFTNTYTLELDGGFVKLKAQRGGRLDRVAVPEPCPVIVDPVDPEIPPTTVPVDPEPEDPQPEPEPEPEPQPEPEDEPEAPEAPAEAPAAAPVVHEPKLNG